MQAFREEPRLKKQRWKLRPMTPFSCEVSGLLRLVNSMNPQTDELIYGQVFHPA
jgi:hypothetical protein